MPAKKKRSTRDRNPFNLKKRIKQVKKVKKKKRNMLEEAGRTGTKKKKK